MTKGDRRVAKYILMGLTLILCLSELCMILSGVDGGLTTIQRYGIFSLGLALLLVLLGVRVT